MSAVDRLFSNPLPKPSVAPSSGPSPLVQSMIAASVARARAQQAEGAQERPETGRLDKRGAALTPPTKEGGAEEAFRQRRKRWALRDVAASILRPEEGRGPSVCGCGRAGFEVEEVGLHLRAAGARTSGTFACDSGWLCPVCAPRKGQERRDRMAEVFDHVKAFSDGQMVMCTLTVRHSRGQGLADLRKVVQAASRKARQGAPWARRKEQHGIFGVISAPEVTFSKANGWHFHIHTALLLRGTGAEAQDLGEWFVRRYLEAVQAAGYSALLDGQDVAVIRSEEKLAEYIAKGVGRTRDVAWEMAGQATKKARSKEGLHPFEILELASGDDGMKALWLEYAAAMKGVRSCVVSPAIAAALGIEADEDEERPGEEQPPEDEQPAGYLRRDIWNTLMSRKRASTVLAALEDFGADRWADVERLALELAGHTPETGEPARTRLHAPSAWTVAARADDVRQQSGCSGGEAVRVAMDRERGHAVAFGMTFRPPPLRLVLELVAA